MRLVKSRGESAAPLMKDLADLRAQGILTDEEFATEKSRVLGD
jgi:hypothetical protein